MRRFLLTSALLILAACGPAPASYVAKDFSIPMRAGWTAVQPPIAGFETARVAFLKDAADGGNVVLAVFRTDLSSTDVANFSTAITLVTEALPEYAEEGREEIDVAGAPRILLSFRTRDPESKSIVHFRQLALSVGMRGYLLKARVPETLDDKTAKELSEMFSSFTPLDLP